MNGSTAIYSWQLYSHDVEIAGCCSILIARVKALLCGQFTKKRGQTTRMRSITFEIFSYGQDDGARLMGPGRKPTDPYNI